MPRSAGLQFRVLGPLEARAEDRVVPLAGVQQRVLLAALLVRPNAVVPADTLIDILWGDAAAHDASTRLAKAVYRLRAAFASAGLLDCVLTQSPGYVLPVEPDAVDAARFTVLLSEARGLLTLEPARALGQLEAALQLWRGAAWADVADHAFVQPEVLRLEGLRAVAVDERSEALLALGRHAELVPQLEAVTQQYPLRERPRAQLMVALYRSGRQADAVSVYRSFRRFLLDEVGLEPSAGLRGLEQDILQRRGVEQPGPDRGWVNDPGLSQAGSSWAGELPPSGARFVGRRRELDWLQVLFDRAGYGAPPVVAIVSGVAGTGKSTLLRAFGRVVHARGARVLFARCDPSLGVEAAVVEAIGGLPVPGPHASPRPGAAGPVSDALAVVGADAPVLLVLEDLDADRAGARAVLGQFAAFRAPMPLLVVGTCRGPAEGVIDDATVEVRTLTGLDKADVAEMLLTISGAARSEQLVESVCAETGALPGLVAAAGLRLRDLDVAARVDRALSRAEAARRSWTVAGEEVARGVLARTELTGHRPGGADALTPGVCPYKGLAAFGVADAAFFAGRERLVAELIAKLAVNRFLAVVGPSGSGKSSLVAAGLLPALASGALPGSERWPCRLIRPGATPMRALVRALASLLDEPTAVIEQGLSNDPGALDILTDAAVTRPGAKEPVVLVIDQFEEAFTACVDPVSTGSFIRAVVNGPAITGDRLAVAVVIRADYYGACALHPELAAALAQSQILVPAMTGSELRRAVAEPARRAGLSVEAGLVDTVVADAAGQPGALPLVATALLESWVRRSGGALTLAGYTDAGGVRGAIGRLADGVYDGLDPPAQVVARRIFLRLAEPDDDRADVRRRARRDELAGSEAEQAVLADLIDGWLLTADEGTVEVAHEALLREWPRLRGWLEENRDGRRLHRHLADAALAWQGDRPDDGSLYRGVRLDAAREWSAGRPGEANQLEREFLSASVAAHERGQRAARRAARRLRSLAAGLAVLLAVALVAGAVAAAQRSRARREATLAQGRELQAEVSRLALLASTLPNAQRDLALLLGVQAFQLQPSNEAAGGLQAALVQSPPQLDRIVRYPSSTFLPHLDHTGQLLAVAGTNGVTVEDLADGTVAQTMRWPHPREFATFSGDDTLVAAGGFDGQIAIWDTATGKLSGHPLDVGGTISYAVFDPADHDRLYAFTDAGLLTTWDRQDPAHPRQIGPARTFAGDGDAALATISPDGKLLAVGAAFGGPVSIYDLTSGTQLDPIDGSLGNFGTDATTLPISANDQTILYNARTGREITAIPTPGGGWHNAVLSRDGRRIAVTLRVHDAFVVQVYDIASHHPVGAAVQLHDNAAIPVGFLPDGRLVTSGNNEAAIWTIGRTLPPLAVPLTGIADITAFLPPSNDVITADEHTTTLARHDPVTGRTLGPLLAGNVEAPMAPDAGGTLLAADALRTGRLSLWNLATGQQLAELPNVSNQARLAWNPRKPQLATDDGTTVDLWNTADPRHPHLQATFASPDGTRPDNLLYSPNGHQLLTAANQDKKITITNIATHHIQWTRTIDELNLTQTAFSPDGKTIAVDSGDPGKGELTLYAAATGRPRGGVPIPSTGGVGYLNAGQWLIVTAGVGTPGAQLYDARTLQPIGMPFPVDTIGPVATNQPGSMFTEAQINTPQLWNTDPTNWIIVACRIAGRNMVTIQLLRV